MYCCPGCFESIADSMQLFNHLSECNQDKARELLDKGEVSNDPKAYELVP